MILLEVLAEPAGLAAPWEIAIEGSYLKPDTWVSRNSAFDALRKDPTYGLWPDSCLDSFVRHGLKEHDAAGYEPMPWKGVTLKCTRAQEAVSHICLKPSRVAI